MPKKTNAKESVAASQVRATNPKTVRTSPVAEGASKPRVTSVMHSKAAAPAPAPEPEPVAETESVPVNAHEQIALIAYGYWEARGFQPGCPEEDWLRAEQEYLLRS